MSMGSDPTPKVADLQRVDAPLVSDVSHQYQSPALTGVEAAAGSVEAQIRPLTSKHPQIDTGEQHTTPYYFNYKPSDLYLLTRSSMGPSVQKIRLLPLSVGRSPRSASFSSTCALSRPLTPKRSSP